MKKRYALKYPRLLTLARQLCGVLAFAFLFHFSAWATNDKLPTYLRWRDTIGLSSADATAKAREITCLNILAQQAEPAFLIQRPTGMAASETCKDTNWKWVFPHADWKLIKVISGYKNGSSNEWDTAVFEIKTRGDNVSKSGDLIAYRINPSVKTDTTHMLKEYIPVRPRLLMVDTIYVGQEVCCVDQAVTFRVNRKGRHDTVAALQSFYDHMTYYWTLTETGNPIPVSSETRTDTMWPVNPFRYGATTVNVQRAFCGFVQEKSISPLASHALASLSNPPLDTTRGKRQDTIYRLVWRAGDTSWSKDNSEKITCANYSDPTNNFFQKIVGKGNHQMSNYLDYRFDGNESYSDGYIFLQVGGSNSSTLGRGDTANSLVKYVWSFNTNLVERIYAGDGNYIPNAIAGNFEAKDWGSAAGDSTFRAIFRVKPQNESNTPEKITISVTPISLYCKDEHGQPFANPTINITLNAPEDTIREYNDFVLKQLSIDPKPCVGSEVEYQIVPKNSVSFQNLRSLYNISTFRFYVKSSDTNTYRTTSSTPPDKFKVIYNPWSDPLAVGAARFSKNRDLIVYAANTCFWKSPEATPLRPAFDKFSIQDSVRITRAPFAPHIYDMDGTQVYPLRNPNTDSVLLCRSHILNDRGLPIYEGSALITGIRLRLINAGDSLVQAPPVSANSRFSQNLLHFFPSNAATRQPVFLRSGGNSGIDFTNRSPGTGPGNDTATVVMLTPFRANANYGDVDSVFFAAQNKCGIGDSSYVLLRITDTIGLRDQIGERYISDLGTNYSETPVDSLPCENTQISFRVGAVSDAGRNVRLMWTQPGGWTSQVRSDLGYEINDFTVGKDTGYISVKSVNKCGPSKIDSIGIYKPYPYMKTRWREVHDTICQDSTYRYSFDTISGYTKYHISFPLDWKIVGTTVSAILPTPIMPPVDSVTKTDLIFANSSTAFWRVTVGRSIDNILVRGIHELCDVERNGRPPRPAVWDTLPVFVHTEPEVPRLKYKEGDTLCAYDTVLYVVHRSSLDSIHQQAVQYQWFFPSADWKVTHYSPLRDSVKVIVGPKVNPADTLRVQALNSACGERGGGVLEIPLTVWDTAVMPTVLDAEMAGLQVGKKPCQGDTLRLYVQPPFGVDSVIWQWEAAGGTWTGIDNLPSDAVLRNNWKLASTTAFPDTFAIAAPLSGSTQSSFKVRLQLRNRCGLNKPMEIELFDAKALVADSKSTFTHFDSILCAGEQKLYRVDTMADADRYVWHFPWAPFSDTVFDNCSRWLYPLAEGEMWVIPANSCSKALESDTLRIKTLRRAPKAPLPVNFALAQRPDWGNPTLTLRDTLCQRSDYDWKIVANPQDATLSLKYHWLNLGGDSIPNINGNALSIARDSMRIHGNISNLQKRVKTLIGITARREADGCSSNGDTLRIEISSVDTVALGLLGNIQLVNLFENPCPGSTVTVKVAKDTAFAYQWILPQGYSFITPPAQQHLFSVDLKVGNKAGVIGLRTRSDASQRFCNYTNQGVLTSDSIRPVKAPIIASFTAFTDSICYGDTLTLKVELAPLSTTAEAYRWQFPQGWTIAPDTLTTQPQITIVVGRGIGQIKVSALDSCLSTFPNEGDTLQRAVYVFNTPSLTVVGDRNACYGSQQRYIAKPSDYYVVWDTVKFNVSEPSITYQRTGDTFDVVFEGRSINFVAENLRHNRCSRLSAASSHVEINSKNKLIVTDTLLGPDTVCLGSSHRYVLEDINNTVEEFLWTIPTSCTHTLTGRKKDTLHITFPATISGSSNVLTLSHQARTLCNLDTIIRLRSIYVDTFAIPSYIFDAKNDGAVFTKNPCGGDTLELYVTPSHRYDTVYWTWNGSGVLPSDSLIPGGNGWTFYDKSKLPDTLSLITPTGVDQSLNIALTLRNQCGTKSYPIRLNSSALLTEQRTFINPPSQICAGESYTFSIQEEPHADQFIWNFSWKTPDTVYTGSSYTFIPTQLGEIWVIPSNGCGIGPSSDTISLETILARPKVTVPLNFAANYSANFGTIQTVFDTACMRKDLNLQVKANPNDDFLVDYHWFFAGGDSLLFAATDSSCYISGAQASNKRFKNSRLGVVAVRENCSLPGDTLFVNLHLVDTVPSYFLGQILSSPALTGQNKFCPETTVKLYVQSSPSPLYQWTNLSGDWSFVGDSLRRLSDTVYVKSGRGIGLFSVQPLTYNNLCGYSSQSRATTDTLKVYTPPVLSHFSVFTDMECAEATVEFTVKLDDEAYADTFVWILPPRFRDNGLDNTEVDNNPDTVRTATSSLSFDLRAGASSGKVSVYAMDYRCDPPRKSQVLDSLVVVVGTPDVNIIGDLAPCRDSVLWYVLQKTDPSVSYTLQVDYGHDEDVEVLVSGDSIRIEFSSDSVWLRFTEIKSSFCGDQMGVDKNFLIISDTTPTITGEIVGPDFVCMDDKVKYTVTKDPSISFNVSFAWVLPNAPSQAGDSPWTQDSIKGENQDSIWLRTAQYADKSINHYDTLLVYATGSCGTSKTPIKKVVLLDTAPSLNVPIIGPSSPVCEGAPLKIYADTSGFGNIGIRWVYLNQAVVEGPDTLNIPSTPKGSFHVFARFKKLGACGWSKESYSSSIVVDVFDLPAQPKIIQNLFPCQDLPAAFSVKPDFWTDSLTWSFSATLDTQLFTRGYDQTLYDSIAFDNVLSTPFALNVQAFNKCGSRAQNVTITPSEQIEDFPAPGLSQIHNQRFCVNDSVGIQLAMPLSHVLTEPRYDWILPSGWTIAHDSVDATNNKRLLRLIPTTQNGKIALSAVGCGATDTIYSALLNPMQLRIAATASVDTTVYGDNNLFVFLSRDSAFVNTSAVALSALNLSWTPPTRLQTGSETKDTAFVKKAFLPLEKFVLRAQENNPAYSQGCTARDTVRVVVNGSFLARAFYPDSLCENASIPISASLSGGEPQHYSLEWFRWFQGSYQSLGANDIVDVPVFDSLMNFMLVAHDTLLGDNNERVPISDTLRFSIKTLKAVDAKILNAQLFGSDKSILSGDSILLGQRLLLTGTAIGNGRPNNYPYSYQWNMNEDFVPSPDPNFQGRSDSTFATTRLIGDSSVFHFFVLDTLTYGCLGHDSLIVRIFWDNGKKPVDFGTLPGGFSPYNADGVNDVFLKFADEITILNRWGVVVYEAKGKKGWDGTDSRSKRLVDRGDYFYVVTLYENGDPNKRHSQTGIVTVF